MTGSRCARFALAVMFIFICGCGSGTTFNPTPIPTSLFPQQITAGSQAFTMFINGSNFQTTTVGQWNGVNRPSFFNPTSEQMSMVVFDSDVANTGIGQVTLSNPAPGGGISVESLSFIINPQAVNGPLITSISPATALAGSNQLLMLTIHGTNLAATDSINWNGTPQTTTASGSPVTSLSTTINAEDIALPSLVGLSVQTSTAKIASPSQKFEVGPASNPTPSLLSLSPSTAKIGTLPPGGYLLVNGKNFVATSVVLFNNSPRSTGYLSDTQLGVQVLASDVVAGGTIAVTVSNPNPGGGASAASNFSIQ